MNFFGYRAAWMLQAMGHCSVQVLDGGFVKWVKENKECEAGESPTPTGGAPGGFYGYSL